MDILEKIDRFDNEKERQDEIVGLLFILFGKALKNFIKMPLKIAYKSAKAITYSLPYDEEKKIERYYLQAVNKQFGSNIPNVGVVQRLKLSDADFKKLDADNKFKLFLQSFANVLLTILRKMFSTMDMIADASEYIGWFISTSVMLGIGFFVWSMIKDPLSTIEMTGDAINATVGFANSFI